MSYTTAPRPSMTRTRGAARRGAERGGVRGVAVRGRGRGRGATGQVAPGVENAEEDSSGRMERRDGYTMIAPNEKKREKIAQQAKREEENYKKHRESRTQRNFSYVGTVGGESVESGSSPAPGGARGRLPVTPSKPFGAKTAYKQSVRQKEEAEIAEKKENARRKAEMNKSKESERQMKLDEDRRLKNEAFLARFDKKPRSIKKADSHQEDAQGATASLDNSSNDDGLSKLTQRFPFLDPETLQEMLSSVGGDVEQAIDLLSVDT